MADRMFLLGNSDLNNIGLQLNEYDQLFELGWLFRFSNWYHSFPLLKIRLDLICNIQLFTGMANAVSEPVGDWFYI